MKILTVPSCLCLRDAFIHFIDFSLHARPDSIDILPLLRHRIFACHSDSVFFPFHILSAFVLPSHCVLSCCRILSTYYFKASAFAFRQWYVSFHFTFDVGKCAVYMFITLSRCFQSVLKKMKKKTSWNNLFDCVLCIVYFFIMWMCMHTGPSSRQYFEGQHTHKQSTLFHRNITLIPLLLLL